MNLSGKRVFLTGGARGIGRGISEALLSKGAMVSWEEDGFDFVCVCGKVHIRSKYPEGK